MSEPFYGYRFEIEKELPSCIQMPTAFGDEELPEEVDFTSWLRNENQQNMGSCEGHMLSNLGEIAMYIASGGEIIQFSPLFAYYASQRVDNLQGVDRGATISAGATVATEVGWCPLELMPYPNPVRYRWELPEKCLKEAANYKCGYKTQITNYDQLIRFIGTGQGGVGIGILWDSNVMRPNSENCVESYRAGGGGHAVTFAGYSTRRARDGRRYPKLRNSWGDSYGEGGTVEVSPYAIDQMFASRYTVAIGVSDLKSPVIRKIPEYSQF